MHVQAKDQSSRDLKPAAPTAAKVRHRSATSQKSLAQKAKSLAAAGIETTQISSMLTVRRIVTWYTSAGVDLAWQNVGQSKSSALML